jgi:hypothetical protein
MGAAFQIPGGNKKGTPITEAQDDDVRYWFNRIAKDLSENPDKQYADRDRSWLAAAKTELVKRGVAADELPIPVGSARAANGNGQAAPAARAQTRPAQSTALAKAAPSQLVGSSRDVDTINARLEEAAQRAHLVSPATVCGHLPEGCEIAISMIKVDPNPDKAGPGEVAPVGGGKLSLSGFVLKRIGAAAGVSWDMNATGRLDDGSDPHYCHYRAVGWVRSFDGSVRCLSGEVEIDMREGSPQMEAMKQRAKDGSNIDSQIRDTRLFLIRHAETKAKLRAIADMGVKRSYTAKELEKPFQVARLMWTGRTDDPELKRIFAEKTADAMIGAASAMYGMQGSAPVRPAPAALAPQHHATALHGPPPLGALGPGAFDDDDFVEGYGETAPPARQSPKSSETSAPATTAADPGAPTATEDLKT